MRMWILLIWAVVTVNANKHPGSFPLPPSQANRISGWTLQPHVWKQPQSNHKYHQDHSFDCSSSAIAVRGGSATNDDDDLALARADYIQSVLLRRLEYVFSGKRGTDFAKWIHQQGGEATIFSMHGLESNNDNNDNNNPSSSSVTQNPLDFQDMTSHEGKIRGKDPFPMNRLNLDIVSTDQSPPSQFPTKDLQCLLDSEDSTPSILQLCRRAITLGINFAPAWSTVGLAYCIPSFRQKIWYKWLAKCIASSGAAWIKWGQWSATRNDMFPEALCAQLASLHSDAPAHSWEFSQLQMESSLGLAKGTLHRVFADFDQTPLASGSIAQVHKAVLGDQLVAVKIRHPRVAALIDQDFRLMSLAARCMDLIPGVGWLRLRESVDQFSHTMAAQAHLQVEGHHLEVLNYNFREWPKVGFPRPFYASSAVIIETFEPGQIVTDVLDHYDEMAEKMNNGQANVQETNPDLPPLPEMPSGTRVEGHDLVPLSISHFIVTTGVGLYLKMLLVDNLMHADLHPGNILLDLHRTTSKTVPHDEKTVAVRNSKQHKQGTSNNYGITLVDAGMVAQLTEYEGSVFIGLLASLGSGDGREAAQFALQFSEENQSTLTEETKEAFTQEMVELFREQCKGYGHQVDVREVLRQVLGLIRNHQIRIDANYATLVVNVLCVESLARRMFPSYNVLEAARPLLESYRGMCYTAEGVPKPKAPRSKLVRLRLSAMYLKKALMDKMFFRGEAKRRRMSLAQEQTA